MPPINLLDLLGMSAKQELRDYIDELSDDEALSLWQRIQCEDLEPVAPLSDEDRAAIERGLADVAAGRVYTFREVRQHLGLED